MGKELYRLDIENILNDAEPGTFLTLANTPYNIGSDILVKHQHGWYMHNGLSQSPYSSMGLSGMLVNSTWSLS